MVEEIAYTETLVQPKYPVYSWDLIKSIGTLSIVLLMALFGIIVDTVRLPFAIVVDIFNKIRGR